MNRLESIKERLNKIDKKMKVFKCSYPEQDSACGIYEGDYLDCSHDECHHPLNLELAEYIVNTPSDIEYLLLEIDKIKSENPNFWALYDRFQDKIAEKLKLKDENERLLQRLESYKKTIEDIAFGRVEGNYSDVRYFAREALEE